MHRSTEVQAHHWATSRPRRTSLRRSGHASPPRQQQPAWHRPALHPPPPIPRPPQPSPPPVHISSSSITAPPSPLKPPRLPLSPPARQPRKPPPPISPTRPLDESTSAPPQQSFAVQRAKVQQLRQHLIFLVYYLIRSRYIIYFPIC